MTEQEQKRLEAIWLASVEKMREVVREFKITQDELHVAGDFFNRLGQSGFSRSLIDVALAMTSVDIFDGAKGGTRPNLLGPYHKPHDQRADGNLLTEPLKPTDTRLTFTGTVRDAKTGAPLPGVELDVWQTDGEGIYDHKGPHLSGLVTSGPDGRFVVHTVLPSDYSQHDHDPIGELFRAMGRTNSRAAHIHLKATYKGKDLLTTQIFMPTSKILDSDYVTGAVSDDLTVTLQDDGVDERGKAKFRTEFDIHLVDVP